MTTPEERAATACQAVCVVGGGKAAKRRGDKAAKWFCPKCGLSWWAASRPSCLAQIDAQREAQP